MSAQGLAFDDVGAGPCVTLLHGHPFDRTLWGPQVSALRSSFRVLAPDLRGFGDSPVTSGTVSMQALGADVIDLLDGLGVPTTAIVGVSMGGVVAMEMVAADPSRFWAVGFVATTAETVTDAERAESLALADETERRGMGPLFDDMQTGLYGPHCPDAVRTRVDAMMLRAPAAGAAASLRGRVARPDYRPGLLRIGVPTFVCAGTEDPWSTAEVTDEIIRHLDHPDVLLLDGIGHLPNLEAEGPFNDALGAFLRAHAPGEPLSSPGRR